MYLVFHNGSKHSAWGFRFCAERVKEGLGGNVSIEQDDTLMVAGGTLFEGAASWDQ